MVHERVLYHSMFPIDAKDRSQEEARRVRCAKCLLVLRESRAGGQCCTTAVPRPLRSKTQTPHWAVCCNNKVINAYLFQESLFQFYDSNIGLACIIMIQKAEHRD